MEKLDEEIKDIDTSYVIITKDEIEKLKIGRASCRERV